MSRVLKIAAVVAILIVVINDVGRWGSSFVDLRNSTAHTVSATVRTASLGSRREAVDSMYAEASKHPIRITEYSIDATTVHIRTEEDVSGTWVVGTVLALKRGMPLTRSFGAPFALHHEASAHIP